MFKTLFSFVTNIGLLWRVANMLATVGVAQPPDGDTPVWRCMKEEKFFMFVLSRELSDQLGWNPNLVSFDPVKRGCFDCNKE